MWFKRYCVVAFATMVALPAALAQGRDADSVPTPQAIAAIPANSAPLTYEQARTLARERHIEARVARQALAAAQARRQQTDGFAPPDFTYDFEESESGNPGRAANRRYGIEQAFAWPGERRNLQRAADDRIALAQAALTRAELRASAQAAKAFDAALFARATARLLAQMVARMEEAVTLSRVRFQGGQGQYLDVLRTQIASQRLANEERQARVAATAAERSLAALLGEREPRAIAGELSLPELPPAEALLARWPADSPSRRLLAARVREAEALTAATRAGRFPDFAIGVQRQRLGIDGATTNAWAGGVRLSVPLPGSDLQRGREAEARADAVRAQDTAAAVAVRSNAVLRQRLDEAAALLAQARDYRDRVLPDAEDQLKAAQQEYRVRRIDALNLLDVYNTYLNTQRDYLASLARYRGAWVDLDTLGEDLWGIAE